MSTYANTYRITISSRTGYPVEVTCYSKPTAIKVINVLINRQATDKFGKFVVDAAMSTPNREFKHNVVGYTVTVVFKPVPHS